MQFSLRTLLAAVAIVGIGAALWVAEPSWWLGAIEFSLSAWVLASSGILLSHSTGKVKAFWLGVAVECIMPTAIQISVNASHFAWHFEGFVMNFSLGFRTTLLLWAFAPVVGLLCVLTHWLLVRPPISNE